MLSLLYFYVLRHILFIIFTLQRDEFTLQRYKKNDELWRGKTMMR